MDLLIALFKICPMKDCPLRYAAAAVVVVVVVAYLLFRKRTSAP